MKIAAKIKRESEKKARKHEVDRYVDMPHAYVVLPQKDGTIAAKCNELPGCFVVVERVEDLHKRFLEVKRLWVETALSEGLEIPEPEELESCPGKLLVRMPRSLHGEIKTRAAEEGVSVNLLINSLLAQRSIARNYEDKMRVIYRRLERITWRQPPGQISMKGGFPDNVLWDAYSPLLPEFPEN
jgi:antitoxin HicB